MIISYKGKTQNFIKEIIAVFYKLKKKSESVLNFVNC